VSLRLRNVLYIAVFVLLLGAGITLVLAFVTSFVGARFVLVFVVGALVLFFLALFVPGSALLTPNAPSGLARALFLLLATVLLSFVILTGARWGLQLAIALLIVALVLYVLSALSLSAASVFGAAVVTALLVVLVYGKWPHIDLHVGQQTERPKTGNDVRGSYHRVVGSIVIDLRKLVVTTRKRIDIKAHVGLGRVTVIAPQRFSVQIPRAHVGAGELVLFNRRKASGVHLMGGQLTRAGTIARPACRKPSSRKKSACKPKTLVLHLSVGAGRIVVRPAPAPARSAT
jgi:hypothetical protein